MICTEPICTFPIAAIEDVIVIPTNTLLMYSTLDERFHYDTEASQFHYTTED